MSADLNVGNAPCRSRFWRCWQVRTYLAPGSQKNIWVLSVTQWVCNLTNIAVDPRHLQVNRRIKTGHWVPTEVKRAMQTVGNLVAADVPTDWTPTRDTRYAAELRFVFPSSRSDIDGPVKRTIDAAFAAIREKTGSPFANDSRVVRLLVTKGVGTEPNLSLAITALDSREAM